MKKTFADKVYELTKKIPEGKVTTYKEIANALGTKAYQAVGSALNKNPFAPVVPCHRVVNDSGKIGGFASGINNKIKILAKEGIEVKDNKIVGFEEKLFRFKQA